MNCIVEYDAFAYKFGHKLLCRFKTKKPIKKNHAYHYANLPDITREVGFFRVKFNLPWPTTHSARDRATHSGNATLSGQWRRSVFNVLGGKTTAYRLLPSSTDWKRTRDCPLFKCNRPPQNTARTTNRRLPSTCSRRASGIHAPVNTRGLGDVFFSLSLRKWRQSRSSSTRKKRVPETITPSPEHGQSIKKKKKTVCSSAASHSTREPRHVTIFNDPSSRTILMPHTHYTVFGNVDLRYSQSSKFIHSLIERWK